MSTPLLATAICIADQKGIFNHTDTGHTVITSNGSKWAGQSPDSIELLLEVLANNPLDRRFEAYGDFIYGLDSEHGYTTAELRAAAVGWVSFHGNFFKLSHVFNIRSNDSKVIEQLTSAIRSNQKRPDYLSQHLPKRPAKALR